VSKRIVQLDGVRALAISAVFLHHALKIKLLWMGVDLFFILSGFLITGLLISSKERSPGKYFGHFYARRARRILPPYAMLLIVTSIVFGLAWIGHWYLYFFLMNATLAFGIAHPESLDILWSLAVEEQFYLVWPIGVYFWSERTIAWVAGALIVAAPILRWICTPYFALSWPIYVLTPFRMDLLAVGALLAVIWRQHRAKIERFGQYGPVASAIALFVLFVLSRKFGLSTYANTQAGNVWIFELSLIICTGVILWSLSGKGIWILTLSPVMFLGRISYSVYLIHRTVLIALGEHLGGKVTVLVLAFAITLVYASLSWYFLEKPLLSTKPKTTDGSGVIANRSLTEGPATRLGVRDALANSSPRNAI
jgi:peptidoglycan/LPS O-acetylase OafA/YrhL